MQNRFVADDFRKTVGIVIDEIDFSKAADFELQPALRERVRLLQALFLCDLCPLFLLG